MGQESFHGEQVSAGREGSCGALRGTGTPAEGTANTQALSGVMCARVSNPRAAAAAGAERPRKGPGAESQEGGDLAGDCKPSALTLRAQDTVI